jgi:hypothetical protein
MNIVSIQSLISNFPFNFVSNDIMSMFSLPVDSIQTIISSPHLHLKNEKQLFEFILKLIQYQRNFLCLSSNSYFGNIDSSQLNCLIQSIQLNELNDNIFNHLKESLLLNYLIFDENKTHEQIIQYLLFNSKEIDDTSMFEENQELNYLFEIIPILSADIVEVKSGNSRHLYFNQDEFFLIQKSKFVQILEKLIEDINGNDFIFQRHCLLIFIPHSITSIDDHCFSGCSSLTQIHLPNSITSIGDYCFSRYTSLIQFNLPIP